MVAIGSKEPLLSWRRLCFLLIGLLVISLLFSTTGPHLPKHRLFTVPEHSTSSQSRVRFSNTFGNAALDNEMIDGLIIHECHALFPDIYQDINRAVAYWKGQNHTIDANDVSIEPERWGVMRILIHENELRILENNRSFFMPFRPHGVLPILQRSLDSAIAAGDKLPTVEVLLSMHDNADPSEGGTHTFWATARHVSREAHQRLWLLPNFDFWWSPPSGSFEDAKRLAMQFDHLSFAEKIPKIVWRGNVAMNGDLRGPLLDVTKDQEWADVISISIANPDDHMEEFEYCKYAMTVYTEGQAFSGRLKFLLNCRSLLIAPEAEWMVHYSHLLKPDGPDQNYVAVKQDWTDLKEKVRWYLDHPDEADRVIANSLATFRSRYTTRAATSCYIRQLIHSYASVSFTPDVMVPMYNGEVFVRKGMAYSDFIQHPSEGDFEHPDHLGV